MLCDWRACGYKQSYIRKNTADVRCGREGWALRDTQREDGQSAVRSAVGAECEYGGGVACRDPDEKFS